MSAADATLLRRSPRQAASAWGRHVLVALAVVAVLIPLAYALRLAFEPQADYLGNANGLRGGFTFANFTSAWSSGGLKRGFLNSLAIVPVGALLATALATTAGFALVKLYVPARRAVLAAIVIAIGVPIPAIMIPLFDQAVRLGIVNSRLGLALIYGCIFAAWGTAFLYFYFQDFPDSLIEAARVDGASVPGVFLRIVVPLSLPAIASVFVINLFIQWGELLLAIVMLPQPTAHPVSVTIAAFDTELRTGGPLAAAGSVLGALPVVAIYFMSQRFLQAGARAGAVKA